MIERPLIDKLYKENILVINKQSDGTFLLTEGCNEHYSVKLTKDELSQLGTELIAMAADTSMDTGTALKMVIKLAKYFVAEGSDTPEEVAKQIEAIEVVSGIQYSNPHY